MKFTLRSASQWPPLWTLLSVAVVVVSESGFLEPLEPLYALRSLAEEETRLPCHYRVEEGEKVVQVSWFKELTGAPKEQVITAHFSEGHTEFGRYSGRVRFEHAVPTENAALLIPHTEESDEGTFICRITTFPSGNFERRVALTVWVLPISSLEPAVLAEGESYRTAAWCRAVGRPVPTVAWDTELPGKAQERPTEGRSVSSHYTLHPLRSMNGKRLDCLVSHPALKQPRRHAYRLVVQYPPDPAITSSLKEWVAGEQSAELVCSSGGNPDPGNVTWTRKGGALPDGVIVTGGKLVFGRPIRMNDSGTYECVAKNNVGAATAEMTLKIAGHSAFAEEDRKHNVMLIAVGAAAGALVLVMVLVILLVHRHHRRKNKRLATELSERTEEMNTLSRTASGRRLNSPDESGLLRVDSRIKSSQSLERPYYRGSQSTLGGRWATPTDVEVDELGRPALWPDNREDVRRTEADGEREERRRRVESYLKNSNMSLDSGLPSSLVPLKPQPEDSLGPREQDPGSPAEEEGGGDGGGGTPTEPDWGADRSTPEEGGGDDGSNSSVRIAEALTNHFYLSNGVLRPKTHSNAVLLHPRGQVI